MGAARKPIPVKLFVGMLASGPEHLLAFEQQLSRAFGPVDLRGEIVSWEHTSYYASEMGGSLKRRFLFFESLRDPGALANAKQVTNRLEADSAVMRDGRKRRVINLDPGYVTEAKVVLATTKDFSHRVYIGEDIYAEVTLKYDKSLSDFLPLEHTYPDFRTEHARRLFLQARNMLREALQRK
ncbi:MAG: DUF4416 family protein [Nitrospiraceae bacterium]|nr:DUF4416 family protein [Nitrospiraceae bacterium]